MSIFKRIKKTRTCLPVNSPGLFFLWLAAAMVSCTAQKKGAVASGETVSDGEVGAAHLPYAIAPISAPFPMQQLKRPVFPAYSVNIRAAGARTGTKITGLIQQAIDEVSRKGGGTVVVPKGNWLTGRIVLKSHVNLHLEEGAVLYFSGAIEDYRPAVFTRIEGVEVMSLGACIYANGQENIAVTGKGKLVGPDSSGTVRKQIMTTMDIAAFAPYTLPVSKRVYEGYNGAPVLPPMFISPINCREVLIEGVTLENTAFWNIVPIYCDGVIIRGVTVHSVGIPRGDGIDIESSRNVLIEYCTLSTGDDCFTIKAGRGADGLRVNRPSENIVVRNCLAIEGHGGITCGSETAGMIRNLYVTNCVFENTRTAIRFKTRRPRGGGGEYLYYNGIHIKNARYVFEWDMLGSAQHVGALAGRLPLKKADKLTPVYRNITARNISVDRATQLVKATALPESPLKNVRIEQIDAKTDRLFDAADVDGFTVRNAVLEARDPLIRALDSRDILFEHVLFKVPGNKVIPQISGPKAMPILFKDCDPPGPGQMQQGKKR
ncbi:glycoside hydrolase family 28 protein [Niabella aurantiaca]|uniref:glycoside hydrolase family 28 protein n=1 Tax=Niabella aurantiaca TaxID=379900 RepID=UPI000370AEF7|nr:glycoside hydrolase family 28 protein [Niabella aurantiaca]